MMQALTGWMPENQVLVAGPWAGEFGWELFCWQAALRRLSIHYQNVVVICPTGHSLLYEDFAQVIEVRTETKDASCSHCASYYIEPAWDEVKKKLPTAPHDIIGPNTYITFYNPARKYPPWINDYLLDSFDRQEFVPYGTPGSYGYDVIIHARDSHHSGSSNRNWPLDMWQHLLWLLPNDLRIASTGSPTAALHLPGTDDIRGMSMREEANVLASSKVIVGPSSGPIHFGSLCRLPHVTWGHPDGRIRYAVDWNPFSTPHQWVSAPGDGFMPNCDDVATAVRKMLCTARPSE